MRGSVDQSELAKLIVRNFRRVESHGSPEAFTGSVNDKFFLPGAGVVLPAFHDFTVSWAGSFVAVVVGVLRFVVHSPNFISGVKGAVGLMAGRDYRKDRE